MQEFVKNPKTMYSGELKTGYSEQVVGKVKGELWDELINTKTGEKQIIHSKVKNLIVNDFSKLMAAVLRNEVGYEGIQYWAVGQGQGVSWDSLTTAQRQAKSIVTLSNLYDEVARVTVSMKYIDEFDIESASITHRLQIDATFGAAVHGHLREFGLFGGNATSSLGSGVMIDHKAHGVIALNVDGAEGMVLNRILRLTL